MIATAALTLAFGFLWGMHGALSATLGGAVNLIAGGAYAFLASRSRAGTAGEALRAIFRAEALKILLILVLLPLVLANYREIVHAAFFTSFVVTVAVFAAAIAVRDADANDVPRTTGDR